MIAMMHAIITEVTEAAQKFEARLPGEKEEDHEMFGGWCDLREEDPELHNQVCCPATRARELNSIPPDE